LFSQCRTFYRAHDLTGNVQRCTITATILILIYNYGNTVSKSYRLTVLIA
jgi:hypothetical protein